MSVYIVAVLKEPDTGSVNNAQVVVILTPRNPKRDGRWLEFLCGATPPT